MSVFTRTITNLCEPVISSRLILSGKSEEINEITENIVTQISSPQSLKHLCKKIEDIY